MNKFKVGDIVIVKYDGLNFHVKARLISEKKLVSNADISFHIEMLEQLENHKNKSWGWYSDPNKKRPWVIPTSRMTLVKTNIQLINEITT